MTLRMVFDREDLQRVRIAAHPDPMWELVLGLHQLRERRASSRYTAWYTQVRHRVRDQQDDLHRLDLLFTLVPMTGGFPDFLTPAPLVTEPEAGLAELRDTAPTRLRGDLGAAFGDRRAPAWVRRLATGERAQLEALVVAVARAHELMLAPHWRDIQAVVRTDRTARMRTLAGDGLGSVLVGMPGVRGWDGTTLEIDYPLSRTVHLGGRGLTFLPSYFCVDRPVTFIDPELPPVLIYPAAGDGAATIGTDYERLDALLSRTRAECLGALTTPRSTSTLARAVGISIPSASKQAAVLREAGLVDSVRDGNSMRHQVTDLGAALLAGEVAHG